MSFDALYTLNEGQTDRLDALVLETNHKREQTRRDLKVEVGDDPIPVCTRSEMVDLMLDFYESFEVPR